MANVAVRRLGLAPCTETEYKIICKREALVQAGDKKALKEFDEKLAAKKAAAEAKETAENKTDGGNKE